METVTIIEATIVMRDAWDKEQAKRLEENIRLFLVAPRANKFVSIWFSKLAVKEMEILPCEG